MDENIPAALVHILRKSGHDVSTAPLGGPDREAAAMAQRESRALLTYFDAPRLPVMGPSVMLGI
ncbi:MAG: DUF5615 family PIN-like protein [Elusimicrobia bacterium]|nr:DUF5615 family PIN-like protein [Elusimicrobiota bacterium]